MRESPWWTFLAGAGVFGILAGYGTAFAGQVGAFRDNGLVPLFGIGAAGTILLACATVGLALRLLLRRPASDSYEE